MSACNCRKYNNFVNKPKKVTKMLHFSYQGSIYLKKEEKWTRKRKFWNFIRRWKIFLNGLISRRNRI